MSRPGQNTVGEGVVHWHEAPAPASGNAELSAIAARLRNPNNATSLISRFIDWWRGPVGVKIANLRVAHHDINKILARVRSATKNTESAGSPLQSTISELHTQFGNIADKKNSSQSGWEHVIKTIAASHSATIQAGIKQNGIDHFLKAIENTLRSKLGQNARAAAVTLCEVATITWIDSQVSSRSSQATTTTKRTVAETRPQDSEVERQQAHIKSLRQETKNLVAIAEDLPNDRETLARLRSQAETLQTGLNALNLVAAADKASPLADLTRAKALIDAHDQRLARKDHYDKILPPDSNLAKILKGVDLQQRFALDAALDRIATACGPMANATIGHLAQKATTGQIVLHFARGDSAVIDSILTTPESLGLAFHLKRQLGLDGLPPEQRAIRERSFRIDYERNRVAHVLNQAASAAKGGIKTTLFSAIEPTPDALKSLGKLFPKIIAAEQHAIAQWIRLATCNRETGEPNNARARTLIEALGYQESITKLSREFVQGFRNAQEVAATGQMIRKFADTLLANAAAKNLQAIRPMEAAESLVPLLQARMLLNSTVPATHELEPFDEERIKAAVTAAFEKVTDRVKAFDKVTGDTPQAQIEKAIDLAIMLAYIEHGSETFNKRPCDLDNAVRTIMGRWTGAGSSFALGKGDAASEICSKLLASKLAVTTDIMLTPPFSRLMTQRDLTQSIARFGARFSKTTDPKLAAPNPVTAVVKEALDLEPGESTSLSFSHTNGTWITIPKTRLPVEILLQRERMRGISIDRDLDGSYAVTISNSRSGRAGGAINIGLHMLNLRAGAKFGGETVTGVRVNLSDRTDCETFLQSLTSGQKLNFPARARVTQLNAVGMSMAVDLEGSASAASALAATIGLMVSAGATHEHGESGARQTDSVTYRIDTEMTAGIDAHVWGLTKSAAGWQSIERQIQSSRGVIQSDTGYVKSMSISSSLSREGFRSLLPKGLSEQVLQRVEKQFKDGSINEANEISCVYRLRPEVLNSEIAALDLNTQLDTYERAEQLAAILNDDASYEPHELQWFTREKQSATAISVPVVLGRSANREITVDKQVVSLRD